jgi:hypothetical protein
MSPGGHAATTALAGGVALLSTSSVPLAAGVVAGGFLIDLDHAVDYVLFNRQRDLRPSAFLRYYLEGRVERVVLALHSYELFALLIALAWWTGAAALRGYVVGGLMHLVLDMIFNGEFLPNSVLAFYSFTYRAAHRFRGATLHGHVPRAPVPAGFWRAFFTGAVRRQPRAAAADPRSTPPAA